MAMLDSLCSRLIEVALPIREISAESVRDKSLRHGHISISCRNVNAKCRETTIEKGKRQ
jgi:hypothetical protein